MLACTDWWSRTDAVISSRNPKRIQFGDVLYGKLQDDHRADTHTSYRLSPNLIASELRSSLVGARERVRREEGGDDGPLLCAIQSPGCAGRWGCDSHCARRGSLGDRPEPRFVLTHDEDRAGRQGRRISIVVRMNLGDALGDALSHARNPRRVLASGRDDDLPGGEFAAVSGDAEASVT
jgi:hypothetical protein